MCVCFTFYFLSWYFYAYTVCQTDCSLNPSHTLDDLFILNTQVEWIRPTVNPSLLDVDSISSQGFRSELPLQFCYLKSIAGAPPLMFKGTLNQSIHHIRQIISHFIFIRCLDPSSGCTCLFSCQRLNFNKHTNTCELWLNMQSITLLSPFVPPL